MGGRRGEEEGGESGKEGRRTEGPGEGGKSGDGGRRRERGQEKRGGKEEGRSSRDSKKREEESGTSIHTSILCKGLLQKAKDDRVVHHKVAEVALLLCMCTYTRT